LQTAPARVSKEEKDYRYLRRKAPRINPLMLYRIKTWLVKDKSIHGTSTAFFVAFFSVIHSSAF